MTPNIKTLAAILGISVAVLLALYLTCSPPWAKCHQKDPDTQLCTPSCQFWSCDKAGGWMDGDCP